MQYSQFTKSFLNRSVTIIILLASNSMEERLLQTFQILQLLQGHFQVLKYDLLASSMVAVADLLIFSNELQRGSLLSNNSSGYLYRIF